SFTSTAELRCSSCGGPMHSFGWARAQAFTSSAAQQPRRKLPGSCWARLWWKPDVSPRLSGIEPFDQLLRSIGKDPFDVRPDEQPVNDEIEWNCVTNAILNERPAVTFLECVLVNPMAVGAANLFVDKAEGRIPFLNQGAPANGNAM